MIGIKRRQNGGRKGRGEAKGEGDEELYEYFVNGGSFNPSEEHNEVNIIPTSQMRKLRYRDTREFVSDYSLLVEKLGFKPRGILSQSP